MLQLGGWGKREGGAVWTEAVVELGVGEGLVWRGSWTSSSVWTALLLLLDRSVELGGLLAPRWWEGNGRDSTASHEYWELVGSKWIGRDRDLPDLSSIAYSTWD